MGEFNEYQPNSEELPTIMELSKEEEEKLIENLKRTDGNARVLVHPFFMVTEKEKEYCKHLERLIEQIAKENFPCFLFEDQINLEKTIKRFQMTAPNFKPYVVKTVFGSPNPAFETTKDAFNVGEKEREDLRGIVDILKDYGLKKSIIGGRKLGYSSNGFVPWDAKTLGTAPIREGKKKSLNLSDEEIPSYCVGELANIMHQEGVEVELSEISSGN